MRRIARKVLLAGSILAGIVFASSFGLIRMAASPPEYYARIIAAESEADGSTRKEQARELVGDLAQMRNDIANDPEWTIRLTDKAINAWLAENSLIELIEDFPPGVTRPRLQFEPERLQLAFRWNGPPIAAIISMSLRPNCEATNELKVGFEDLRVGMLPLSGQRFQKEVVERLKSAGIAARWIDEGGIPTLAMTVAPRLHSKSVELDRITLLDGEIRIGGRSRVDAAVERLGQAARESVK